MLNFTSFGMRADGISFKIQNLSEYKHLVAVTKSTKVRLLEFDEGSKDFKEVDSLEFLYSGEEVSKDFDSILERSAFSDQIIVVSAKGGAELFKVIVSRDHQDNPPIVKLLPSEAVKSALYYPRVGGGGSSYLIATGKSEMDVSVEAVKAKQQNTRRQVYFPVE
jgi:hypothetical protein